MKKISLIILNIIHRFGEDRVTVYSAQASFFLIVSLGPFMIALAAMVQFFIPESSLQSLDAVLQQMPVGFNRLMNLGLEDIFTSAAPSIISVSAIVAFWSASKGVVSLQRCLRQIYGTGKKDNFLLSRIKAVFHTFLLILAIVFAMGFLVFGNFIQHFLERYFPILEKISFLIILCRSLLVTAIFIFVFAAFYLLLSGAKRKFRQILPGVVFSTIGWITFSILYAYYISHYSNYTVLYGTLGAFTLLMLWIYFCIIILLLGAEINVCLENRYLL